MIIRNDKQFNNKDNENVQFVVVRNVQILIKSP